MEPTHEQIAEIAQAAIDAAMAKTKELGFEWWMFALGIERAYKSLELTARIFELLGDDMTIALGKELAKAQAYDMLKEAEGTINEH